MKPFFSLIAAVALAAGLAQIPLPSGASASLSQTDASEISTAYGDLTGNFYKPVNVQAALDSARHAMLAALQHAGIKHATLPALHASHFPDANIHHLQEAVRVGAREGGAKLSAHALAYAALRGLMGSVHDRYTVFLDPKEFAALNGDLDGGDFGGTGIVIQVDAPTKEIHVNNIVPGGPADKAGVEQDDIITAIDGVSTKGMSLQRASSRLRGKPGTVVRLTVDRAGKPLPTPISIVRAKIHDLSVFEKMLPGKIGYVELTVFGSDTGAELDRALDRLQQEGARAIVLDLRDNGGGYLNAAVDVSSKFIPSGPIVSVEQASLIRTIEANGTAISPLPLAVLVNRYTASASEITSGAIQDSDAGAIVGERTFGKGVVQTIYPLPDRSALKITTARYLTPHNRNINHRGITPDITVSENKQPRFGDPQHDSQLARAIRYLDTQIADQQAADLR